MASKKIRLALLACAAFVLPDAAGAATYTVKSFKEVARFGNFTPSALIDGGSGGAFGTFSYAKGPKGSLAIEAVLHGAVTADYCGTNGVSDLTEMTAISPYSDTSYFAGQCDGSGTGFVYSVATEISTPVVYPNAVLTNVFGVNSGGLVAGRYYDQSDVHHGFYLVAGTYISFDPPGSVQTDPLGMSPANTVFGTYLGTDFKNHGFLFDQFFNTTVIDYPGALFTQVNALNSHNQAAGSYSLPSGGAEHAFFWQNGNYTELQLAQSAGIEASVMNESGVVGGTYVDGANVQHGFVWKTATGQVLTFDAPSGGTGLFVTAINNQKQVAGFYQAGKKRIGFLATCTGRGCF